FTKTKKEGRQAKWPLIQVLRDHPVAVLRVIGVAVATNGTGYIGLTYMNIYLIDDLGFPADQVSWLSAGVIALACLTMPLVGLLSDRAGRRKVIATGVVGYLAISYPVLALMESTSSMMVIGVLYLAFMVLNALLQVPAFPMFTELFGGSTRYTGVALGFNLGTILAGGTAPYMATWLVQQTGDNQAPAFWVMGAALIGLLSLIRLKETANTALPT